MGIGVPRVQGVCTLYQIKNNLPIAARYAWNLLRPSPRSQIPAAGD